METRLRQVVFFLCLAAAVFLLAFLDQPSYRYEGASRCAGCHSSVDIGDQYGIWASSPHRNALACLSTEKGKALAKEKGVLVPTRDAACLSCHMTGYEASFDLLGPYYRREDGVSCESCHGAGGGYAFFSIMYDRQKSIKKGLVDKPEMTCVRCHDGKAHAMPPFVLSDALKKITHPIPGRTGRK
jgi:hypothetical protein